MNDSALDWTEFLQLLGELPEKGPQSPIVAKAEALEIIESYHRRLAERAAGQTYAVRRSRLNRIEKAAEELVEALVEAGPECQEELKVVGDWIRAPQNWTSERAWLSDLGDLGPVGNLKGMEGLESTPALAFRVAALHAVIELALGNSNMASRPGKGQKPITLDEASPALHLVNDCWDLLLKFQKRPRGGINGLLNEMVLAVGYLATDDYWNLDRLKREISHVVKVRTDFQELEVAFDKAWMKAGSPLLRGPHLVDKTIQELANKMHRMIARSEGLLHATHRLTAWKAHLRLRRAVIGSEQNPQ